MVALVDNYSKDQRTVFVSQLVMRATERDIRKYLSSKSIPVNEIEFMQIDCDYTTSKPMNLNTKEDGKLANLYSTFSVLSRDTLISIDS